MSNQGQVNTIQVAHVALTLASDPTPIQDFLNANPSITLFGIQIQGLDVYIFYY